MSWRLHRAGAPSRPFSDGSGAPRASVRGWRRTTVRALAGAAVLAVLVASIAYAKFGSRYSNPCDTTIYAECVANSATSPVMSSAIRSGSSIPRRARPW